jgi:uncharacterized protein (DUF488 family)
MTLRGLMHVPVGRRRPAVRWRNQSFHNYADYALSPDFAVALFELRELGRARHVAIMCAEAVWWRCHRRIIADHLISAEIRSCI